VVSYQLEAKGCDAVAASVLFAVHLLWDCLLTEHDFVSRENHDCQMYSSGMGFSSVFHRDGGVIVGQSLSSLENFWHEGA